MGLEGGVENSSAGGSSSNFVNVTITRIVGTTGIATWKHEQLIKQVKTKFSFLTNKKPELA